MAKRCIVGLIMTAGVLQSGWLSLGPAPADGRPPPSFGYLGITRVEQTFPGELRVFSGNRAPRLWLGGGLDPIHVTYHWRPPLEQQQRGLEGVEAHVLPMGISRLLTPFPAHKWTVWVSLEEWVGRFNVDVRTELWTPERMLKDPTILKRYSIATDSWVLPYWSRRYSGLTRWSFELASSQQDQARNLPNKPEGIEKQSPKRETQSEPKLRLSIIGYYQSREEAEQENLLIFGYETGVKIVDGRVSKILEKYGYDFSKPMVAFYLEQPCRVTSEGEGRPITYRKQVYLYVARSPREVVLLLPDYRCLRLRNIQKPGETLKPEVLSEEYHRLMRVESSLFVSGWVEFEGRLIPEHEELHLPAGAQLVRPILIATEGVHSRAR